MKFRLLSFLFILFLLLTGIHCKAPRNNPFDPLNPDYNFGTIEGIVQSIGIPREGISQVKVIWENANLIAETDSSGRFTLNNIPINDGNIVFSKDGYRPDTLQVTWGTSKRFFAQVFFNRVPTLDTVSIYTIFLNQTGLPATSSLFVKAWVTDQDDDLDSVFVVNDNLTLKKPLDFFQAEGSFQTTILESEMGGNNIEETIGLDFSIVVKDKYQNEFVIGENRVTRVIKDEVSGLFPSGDSTININNQPVILNWNEFQGGYSFTYKIDVYKRNLLNTELVHTVTGIQSNIETYTLPFNLPGGDYIWTIWIIDQFQNRSNSKPVSFKLGTP